MRPLIAALLCLAWPAWADESVLIKTCLLAEGQRLDQDGHLTFVDSLSSKPGAFRGGQIAGVEEFKLTDDSLDCIRLYTASGYTFFARVVDKRYEGLSSLTVLRRIMDRQ